MVEGFLDGESTIKKPRIGSKSPDQAKKEREAEEEARVQEILDRKSMYKANIESNSELTAKKNTAHQKLREKTSTELKNTSVNLRLDSYKGLHSIKGELIGTNVDVNFRILVEWAIDELKKKPSEEIAKLLSQYQALNRK